MDSSSLQGWRGDWIRVTFSGGVEIECDDDGGSFEILLQYSVTLRGCTYRVPRI